MELIHTVKDCLQLVDDHTCHIIVPDMEGTIAEIMSVNMLKRLPSSKQKTTLGRMNDCKVLSLSSSKTALNLYRMKTYSVLRETIYKIILSQIIIAHSTFMN